MHTPSNILRAPADAGGPDFGPDNAIGASKYFRSFCCASKKAVGHLAEVLFGCHHGNLGFPHHDRQTCLDCGDWRRYLLTGPGDAAVIGPWNKPELPATVAYPRAGAAPSVAEEVFAAQEGWGVDLPGVGRVPPLTEYQEMPQALRDFLDGEGPDIPTAPRGVDEEDEDYILVDGVRYLKREIIGSVAGVRKNEERERLLIKLLFAAKNLAASRVIVGWPRPKFPHCLECRAGSSPNCDLQHASTCKAGRVLRAIAELESQVLDSNLTRKEETEVCHRAGVGNRPRGDFNEPWSIRTDGAWAACLPLPNIVRVYDAAGVRVLSGLNEFHERALGKRVVACVNFCAGSSTEALVAEMDLFTCGDCGRKFRSAGDALTVHPSWLTPRCDECARKVKAGLQ